MSDTAPRESWRVTFICAAAAVALLGWHTLFEPFGRDQGIHSTIAYAWGEGLMTYSEVYNIKPPLTTLMHRLSQMLFGANMQAIRALDILVVLASVIGMVGLMQRMNRSRAEAGFTGVGFAVIYYALTYWEHAQTDGWAGMSVIATMHCLLSGWRSAGSRRMLWMLAAGAALGVGFMFKYTIGGALLLVFVPLLARKPDIRFRLTDLILFVLGGAAIVAAILAYLWIKGALIPFFEIQNYIRGYLGYTANPGLLHEITAVLSPTPANVLIVMAGVLPWLASLMRGDSLFFCSTLIWGFAAFLSGHVQGKGSPYHFMPLIPVYAILWGHFVAAVLAALTRSIGRPLPARALLAVGLAWVLMATFIWPRTIRTLNLKLSRAPVTEVHAFQPMPPDFDVVATEEFADILARHRAPGDSLFVWGYETMLYLLVQEPPRYRYPYAWPFVVDFHDGRYTADLMARLEADPPKHIVVQDGDGTPWVTGRPESSAQFLEMFPELRTFIDAGYEDIEKTDRFTLLQRRE